jgi:transcriptional regulator with XRE-family HTH domain
VSLAELRKELGVTQVEMAKAAEMTQSELSKLERRDDHLVSTLRRAVRALGGELEVTAVVGNKRISSSACRRRAGASRRAGGAGARPPTPKRAYGIQRARRQLKTKGR